jgi:hypothetical protein
MFNRERRARFEIRNCAAEREKGTFVESHRPKGVERSHGCRANIEMRLEEQWEREG